MRVVTYNVWNVEGEWERRAPALVGLLREVEPDILGLQEVCVSETDPNQAEELAEALDMEMVSCLLPSPHRGHEFRMGNAVLSRWPITQNDETVVPSPRNNRSCVRAAVETPDGVVQVFVAHLSADLDQADLRQSQIDTVLEWAEPYRSEPCLLLGDFNAAPETGEIRQITADGAGDSWLDTWAAVHPADPGLTSVRANPYRRHRTKPDRRVDYVFLRDPTGRWKPRAARIVGDHPREGVFPSDHFGVCVDLEHAC
jgi:endonuclease/exonuclease/phosphatase family metal-dependent hydrolase